MFRSHHLAPIAILGLLLAALTGCRAAPAATIARATAMPGTPESLAATVPAATTTAVAKTSVSTTPMTLNVFAAASLTDAFAELGRTFEAEHPGVTVVFNFGASNHLAQGIVEGAPADVFASANKKQMDVLIEAGQVAAGTQHTFARNRLVVIYPRDNPAGLRSLQDLARPGLKLVLAAREVPAGQYALDFLGKASQSPAYTAAFSETVVANVVSYEENVRAVLSKVSLGEADAGIVYASDVGGEVAKELGRVDIPDQLNTIADYPLAPLKDAPNAELARDFVSYILSPAAQAALASYGFIPVAE